MIIWNKNNYTYKQTGPGWLNELGSWISQLIQAYHQHDVGSSPALCITKKRCARIAVASDKVYQLLAHDRWFSPGTPPSSTTKTGRHEIAEILLKVALNTKHQIKSHINIYICIYITPTQQFFSYIMARTSYISMR